MTNLLSRYAEQRFSFARLNSNQLAMDSLLSQVETQATDWRSIASMFVAGAVGKVISTSLPVLGRGVWAASVAGESFAFEASHRLFNTSSSQESFLQAFQCHFINFATMRLLAPFGARTNPLLQLNFESGGMVLGQNLSSYLQGTSSEKSLSAQFLEASVFALQNRISFAGLHALTGGRLQLWERSLDLTSQASHSNRSERQTDFHFPRQREIFSRMAASHDEREIAKETHRAHQKSLMATADHSAYFRVLEEPVPIHHTWEDIEALMRIRSQQRSSSGGKSSILGVSIFIRDSEGRVLLTYDARDTTGQPRIPSESVEFEDGSIEEVALRGIREELGAEAKIVGRIARIPIQFYTAGNPEKLMNYYLLEAKLTSPVNLPQEGEVSKIAEVASEQDFRFSPEGMYPGINEVMNRVLKQYLLRDVLASRFATHSGRSFDSLPVELADFYRHIFTRATQQSLQPEDMHVAVWGYGRRTEMIEALLKMGVRVTAIEQLWVEINPKALMAGEEAPPLSVLSPDELYTQFEEYGDRLHVVSVEDIEELDAHIHFAVAPNTTMIPFVYMFASDSASTVVFQTAAAGAYELDLMRIQSLAPQYGLQITLRRDLQAPLFHTNYLSNYPVVLIVEP